MEIKCANFKTVYSDIEKVIQDASYVALDVEFLGLDVEESNHKCSLFDTPEERYEKLAHSIKRFAPVQLGLAFFMETSDPDRYDVHPYNIYLYKQGVQGQTFDFSVSSLSFLKNHGFDFNNFVTHGVSHLNLDELDAVISELLNSHDGLDSFGPYMRDAVNRIQQTLYHRLARYRRKSTGSESSSPRFFEPFLVNIDREQLTELQKAVLLYKLYCGVPGVRMKILDNYVECDSSRLTKRELVQIKQGILARIKRELMGVSEIIMAIIEKKLPLVAHNGLHDLMYLYHYFVANLPGTYAEFKRVIHTIFPVCIDTKHLAEECTHKLSWFGIMSYRLEILGNFFGHQASNACAPKIEFNMVHPLEKRITEKKSYHNAGFDAVTTGKIFIRLSHLVAKPMHMFECGPTYHLGYLLDAVSLLSNRVPVPLLGIPYVNITGEDPPSRKPGEVTLTLREDVTIQTLQQELKEQFGSWRCDIRVEGDVVRVASNTETTYRRVYNYFLSRSSYNVLDVCPSPSSSYSSPYRTPSPCNESLGSNSSLSSLSSKYTSPTKKEYYIFDSFYSWVHKIGSFLLDTHIMVSGTRSLI